MMATDSQSMKSSDQKLTESKVSDLGDALHIETTSHSDDESDSIEQTDTGKVTWLISATVSLGGFLFGIAAISVLPSFRLA